MHRLVFENMIKMSHSIKKAERVPQPQKACITKLIPTGYLVPGKDHHLGHQLKLPYEAHQSSPSKKVEIFSNIDLDLEMLKNTFKKKLSSDFWFTTVLSQ